MIPFATYHQYAPSAPAGQFRHGELVWYIGVPDMGMTPGHVYQVWGDYPQPWNDGLLGISVDDPDDDFGGVLALSVKDFEKVSP